MKIIRFFLYALITTTFTLTGCSETPVATVTYSGKTTPVSINDTNSPAMAKATITATLVTKEIRTLLESLSATCVSGAINQDINILDGSVTFTFSNCDLGTNQILNGQATVSGDLAGTASIAFTDFTIKNNAGTTTNTIENLVASCTGGIAGSCTLVSDFTGPGGLIYRATNFTAVKDVAADLTTITGRLYHPDYGYVDITTTTAISFGTCGTASIPDGGIIQFTSSNSATITYTCTDITTSITGGTTTTAIW